MKKGWKKVRDKSDEEDDESNEEKGSKEEEEEEKQQQQQLGVGQNTHSNSPVHSPAKDWWKGKKCGGDQVGVHTMGLVNTPQTTVGKWREWFGVKRSRIFDKEVNNASSGRWCNPKSSDGHQQQIVWCCSVLVSSTEKLTSDWEV